MPEDVGDDGNGEDTELAGSAEFCTVAVVCGLSALIDKRGGCRSLQADKKIVKNHVVRMQLLRGHRMLFKFNVWWRGDTYRVIVVLDGRTNTRIGHERQP
ncbi:MAG TPA: hypothetical protein VGJ04_04750 [Pirellulales bacterium]